MFMSLLLHNCEKISYTPYNLCAFSIGISWNLFIKQLFNICSAEQHSKFLSSEVNYEVNIL